MSLSLLQTISNAHSEYIWNVKFHPTLPIIASCGSDKTIVIWYQSSSSSQYEKTSILSNTHSRTIRSISWSPNGDYLAAASMDSLVSIWKLTSSSPPAFECLTTLEGHENEVKSVSWSISGNFIASCARDKTIWIWDIENIDQSEFSCNSVLQGHTQDIKMVKWSPREDVLFSASFDDTIKIWRYDSSQDDWTTINTLSNHSGTVWCIDFNKKGDQLVSCSDDMSVIFYNIDFKDSNAYQNIKVTKKIQIVCERVLYSCCFTSNDEYVIVSSGDNSIAIVKVDENDKEVKVIDEAHEDDVNCVDCDKNNGYVVSCSDDSSIKVWKIKY